MALFDTILVTGANRGLGLEFIRQLLVQARPPAVLIGTTRSPSDALNQLAASNPNLHILTYESTNYASYPAFVTQITRLVGEAGLSLLVNNAGIYVPGTLETPTLAKDVLRNFEVNAVAPLELTRVLLPLLKTSASGKRKTLIANISSDAGSIGDNSSGSSWISMPYRTSKAALNALSRSQAIDLKAAGIAVLSVHPGWVQTDLGGDQAPLTADVSIAGMLELFEKTSLGQSGSFINYLGKDVIL